MTQTQKGIAYLIGSAFLYSIMPVFIRFVDAGHVSPISQTFLRYIFAFLSALAYFKFSKAKLNLKKDNWKLLILMGIFGYALTNLFFTYGIIYTQISTALFIFYSFAIITPILAFIFLKEKVNRYNVTGLILALLALSLLFRPTSLVTWRLGSIFAVLSALAQSFFLIGRKKITKYSSQLIMLSNTFLGMITLGILAFIFDPQFYFDPSGLQSLTIEPVLVLIVFGIDNFLAWFLMSKGFALVKASVGSLVLLLENVFAAVFSFLILSEVPTTYTLIGGVLILTAASIVAVKGSSD